LPPFPQDRLGPPEILRCVDIHRVGRIHQDREDPVPRKAMFEQDGFHPDDVEMPGLPESLGEQLARHVVRLVKPVLEQRNDSAIVRRAPHLEGVLARGNHGTRRVGVGVLNENADPLIYQARRAQGRSRAKLHDDLRVVVLVFSQPFQRLLYDREVRGVILRQP